MQGMNGEHRCHKRAAPKSAGHSLQGKEEKDRRDCVQEDIGKMMPACFQPIQLTVQHVCDRRQRMPVFSMNMSECPGNTAYVKAAGYPGILINLSRSVGVNGVVHDRPTRRTPCTDR